VKKMVKKMKFLGVKKTRILSKLHCVLMVVSSRVVFFWRFSAWLCLKLPVFDDLQKLLFFCVFLCFLCGGCFRNPHPDELGVWNLTKTGEIWGVRNDGFEGLEIDEIHENGCFSGSKKREIFKKNVKFVKSQYTFCQNHSILLWILILDHVFSWKSWNLA
jgi:hypothetical protein